MKKIAFFAACICFMAAQAQTTFNLWPNGNPNDNCNRFMCWRVRNPSPYSWLHSPSSTRTQGRGYPGRITRNYPTREKKQYNVYPKNQVFNVFNVAQTNLQQVRPEIYAKLEEQCAVKLPVQDGEIFSFPALDAMIENNAWVCPIMPEKQVIFFRITLTHI